MPDGDFGPYLTKPGRDVEEQLRQHIGATGMPETFRGVLLRPLPEGANPELVLRNVQIDRKKRPDGQMAPCAECSPKHPKYLNGGVLWCPEDGYLRPFGCDCVERRMGAAAYREMQQRRSQVEDERDADEFLLENWALIEPLRAFVESLTSIAGALETAREQIDGRVRGWRTNVRDATKGTPDQLVLLRQRRVERDDAGERVGPRGFGTGDYETVPEVVGPFVGRTFVSRTFDPRQEVTRLSVLIPGGDWSSEEGAFRTCSDMTVAERVALVRELRRFSTEAPKVTGRLADARRFFTTEAIASLGRWGGDRDAPTPFTARVVDGHVEIRHAGHVCRVPLLDRLVVPPLDPAILSAMTERGADR